MKDELTLKDTEVANYQKQEDYRDLASNCSEQLEGIIQSLESIKSREIKLDDEREDIEMAVGYIKTSIHFLKRMSKGIYYGH